MTTAARHLLIDVVRRHWSVYAVTIVLALAMMLVERGGLSIQTFYVASMEATLFLAVVPFSALLTREVRLLPLPRREMWRVQWTLSTVVPVLVITLAKLFAVATVAAGVLMPDQLLLSGVYDFLYCGLIVGICTMAPFWVVAAVFILNIPVLVLIRGVLPIDPASIDVVTAIALVAAAAVTVRGYLYSPPATPRPVPAAVPRTPVRRARFAIVSDRLGGLPSLVWREARIDLLSHLALLALLALGSLLDGYGPAADRGQSLFPLVFTTSIELTGPILGMVFVMGMVGDDRLARELRLWRTLPIAAVRLAVMLTAFTLLSAALLWFVLFIGQALLLRAIPLTWRLDLFLLIAGVWAVARSVCLLVPGGTFGRSLTAMLMTIPTVFAFRFAVGGAMPVPVALSVFGVTAILASIALNYWGLSRSSRMYKRKPVWPPFANPQNQA